MKDLFFFLTLKKYNKIIRKKKMKCTNAVKNHVLWGEKDACQCKMGQ